MIKKAIDRILELAQPSLCEIGTEKYSNQDLYRIEKELRAKEINLSTLTGFADYIRQTNETKESGKYIVHVVSETTVSLLSFLDGDRERECLVKATANLPEFPFGRFCPTEDFLIGVQSKFADSKDRAAVLKFAGTVKNGTIKEASDDGITQKATIKTGIASLSDAIVPSPCRLIPYRTFAEAEQPESSFIFRMRENREGATECALFEADGGAWKAQAMQNIRKYLEGNIDLDKYIIIS